jgi:hypothetical protein
MGSNRTLNGSKVRLCSLDNTLPWVSAVARSQTYGHIPRRPPRIPRCPRVRPVALKQLCCFRAGGGSRAHDDPLQAGGKRRTYRTVVIKGMCLVLLVCELVSKAAWAEMILARKRREGHDFEGSHLCGNSTSGSPWHLVAETHSQNMARKACHKDDRCKCKQPIRCHVGPNLRQMAGKESEWQTALENAQG